LHPIFLFPLSVFVLIVSILFLENAEVITNLITKILQTNMSTIVIGATLATE